MSENRSPRSSPIPSPSLTGKKYVVPKPSQPLPVPPKEKRSTSPAPPSLGKTKPDLPPPPRPVARAPPPRPASNDEVCTALWMWQVVYCTYTNNPHHPYMRTYIDSTAVLSGKSVYWDCVQTTFVCGKYRLRWFLCGRINGLCATNGTPLRVRAPCCLPVPHDIICTVVKRSI